MESSDSIRLPIKPIQRLTEPLVRFLHIEAASGDGETPLHRATDRNRTEAVKLLIDKGADVNATRKDGWTPLHIAVNRNRKELVEMLIAKGADTKTKNKAGRTPLDIARARSSSDIIEILKKHEARE